MPRARLLVVLFAPLLLWMAGCMDDGGPEGPVGSAAPHSLTVASSAFEDGARMPDKYTCEGSDVKPPLAITDIPEEAASLVLIMDDPDAPRGTITHYTVWNIPADDAAWDEGADLRARGAAEGATSLEGGTATGYGGPCPPPGDDAHTYIFRVYALEGSLDLDSGSSRGDVESAMRDQVLATGILTGTYSREA